jgi:creatinine amidohydrolase
VNTSRLLHELSSPATATALSATSILVMPVGAIEGHGPHLPLSTDALIAEASATAAVARAAQEGLDVWQLPTLSITKSDEHAWASGTLWLEPETMLRTIGDIGRSVTATPARTLVFLNGHGGNIALLGVALRDLRRRFGLRTFLLPAPNISLPTGAIGLPDELGMGIHGGFVETSLVMHLRPDLVDASQFVRSVPEELASFRHIGFAGRPVGFGWLSDDFDASGVIGDPSEANAAAGASLFDGWLGFAAEALHEIARFPLRSR